MNPISKFGKKFIRNDKAFSSVLIAIITVVVAVIMVMVAAIVLSKVSTSLDRTGLSQAANDTLDAADTQGFGALNLLLVSVIVLAAVAIIGAVVGIFAYIKIRS
jgi:ABC-type phosphate transport system permease subunit